MVSPTLVSINHGCWDLEALWMCHGEHLKLNAECCIDVHFVFPGERVITFHQILNINCDNVATPRSGMPRKSSQDSDVGEPTRRPSWTWKHRVVFGWLFPAPTELDGS